jgi:NhaP-type Na+/H+ or K+/H+ antiporter
MKKHRLLSLISNILLGAGAVLGAVALYLSFSLRASLPPGVCPIDNNRPLIYIAIAVLLGSFVLSVIADRMKKRDHIQ